MSWLSRGKQRQKRDTFMGWMAVNDFMETHLMRLSDYFRVGTGAPSQFIIPTQ